MGRPGYRSSRKAPMGIATFKTLHDERRNIGELLCGSFAISAMVLIKCGGAFHSQFPLQ
jgi:hypothetical protein